MRPAGYTSGNSIDTTTVSNSSRSPNLGANTGTVDVLITVTWRSNNDC